MCFSERVSWLTFVASVVGSSLLFAKGTAEGKVLGLFFGLVSLMQMYEALLWRQDGRCTATNEVVSKIGAVTNHLQPLVMYLACRHWLRRPSSATLTACQTIMAAYLLVFGFTTLEFVGADRDRACTRRGRHGLVWQWNDVHTWSYALFLCALLAVISTHFSDTSVFWIVLGSYVVSHAIYRNTKMVGSIWCFIGALLPWYFI